MGKIIFLENKGQRKPTVCIQRPHAAYAGTSLRMQLGFQRHKKRKFLALKTEVWNESHIIQEPFQTPIFQLYKALHGTFSKDRESPKEKSKIHQKIVDQKGDFHKTLSSHFYLIGTFSSPNSLSLKFLITVLLKL